MEIVPPSSEFETRTRMLGNMHQRQLLISIKIHSKDRNQKKTQKVNQSYKDFISREQKTASAVLLMNDTHGSEFWWK